MTRTKNTNQSKPKSKRYATHVTTPTGGRVYISAKSPEELEKKVAQARLEMGVGVDIADTTKFEDYAYVWFNTYKSPKKLRENSYALAKWILEDKVIPNFKGLMLKEVKPLHIQAFLSAISPYSRSVQAKCLQQVRGIFRSAEENGLIYKSPVRSSDKPGGETAVEKEALTNEQATLLLEATFGTPCYLFCLLALSTGMRRSEIFGLMWEDVDFEAGCITVTHSKAISPTFPDPPVTTLLKTESSHRKLPIPPLLRQALEAERSRSNSPFVLAQKDGSSYTMPAFSSMWCRIGNCSVRKNRPLGYVGTDSNGVPYKVVLDFHCHPHLLRHTCITSWFEAGLDLKQVQYLAGHSTPEMTLKVYTHYRAQARLQETTNKVHAASEYLSQTTNAAPATPASNIIRFPGWAG